MFITYLFSEYSVEKEKKAGSTSQRQHWRPERSWNDKCWQVILFNTTSKTIYVSAEKKGIQRALYVLPTRKVNIKGNKEKCHAGSAALFEKRRRQGVGLGWRVKIYVRSHVKRLGLSC